LARERFDPGCPVVILQGLQDADVPAEHTREIVKFLTRSNVKLVEIADGEHRLSRPQDLEILFAEIGKFA
jgi:dipeptidyl aminopeptidase/acylaminoacyl peptidase